jgi:hypothetical protein
VDEEVEGVGVEDAGIVGEEAEEEADEEDLAAVVGIAGVFEGVGQLGHEVGGGDVDGGFFGEGVRPVAGDEGEVLHVAVEFLEGEIRHERAVGVQVVELEAGEIGGGDVVGNFRVAAFAEQVLDVVEGLALGLAEILAGGLVFGEEPAFPEQVDAVVGALEGADGFLEHGDRAAGKAEDVEKGVPERFGLGGFAGLLGPLAGEGDGARLDFGPAQWHGKEFSRSRAGRRWVRPFLRRT